MVMSQSFVALGKEASFKGTKGGTQSYVLALADSEYMEKAQGCPGTG